MKSFILLIGLLIAFSSTYAAKITDNTLYVGKDAADDFKIIAKDTGYIKKAGSNGDWFFSKDGVIEQKFGSGSGGGAGINVLLNASFEDGTASWTNTNGVYTSEDSIKIDGSKSAKIALTAQTLDFYQTVTNTQWNDQTVYASCYIKSSVADIQVCFFDGTTEYNCMDYDASNVWKKANGFIPKVASGLMGVKVKTTSSQTGDVYIDGCVVGDQVQIGTSVIKNSALYYDIISDSAGEMRFETEDHCDSNLFTCDNTSAPTKIIMNKSMKGVTVHCNSYSGATTPSVGVKMFNSSDVLIRNTSNSGPTGHYGSSELTIDVSAGDYFTCYNTGGTVIDLARGTYFYVYAQEATSGLAVESEIGTQIIRYDGFTSLDGSKIKFKTRQYNKDSNNGDTSRFFSDDNTSHLRLTASQSLSGIIAFNGISTATQALRIKRYNSSDVLIETFKTDTSAGSGYATNIGAPVWLDNGDYLEFESTGALNDVAESTFVTFEARPKYMKLLSQIPFPVDNSVGNVRVESCRILNSGTASFDTDSGLCGSWLTTSTRTASGILDIAIDSGIFSKKPVCNVSVSEGSIAAHLTITVNSATSITVESWSYSGPTPLDMDVSITCQGVK